MGLRSPSSTRTEFSIRRATADDAEAYARTHVAALHQTYAQIMPQEFHDHYEADLANLIRRRRAALANDDGVDSWVAFDSFGRPVGIASSGPVWHSRPMFRMHRT